MGSNVCLHSCPELCCLFQMSVRVARAVTTHAALSKCILPMSWVPQCKHKLCLWLTCYLS